MEWLEMPGRVVLLQSCAGWAAFYVGVEWNTSDKSPMDDLIRSTMRIALEEAIEAHFEPNACVECGNRKPPLGAARIGDERIAFCPACYPVMLSKPEIVSQLQY